MEFTEMDPKLQEACQQATATNSMTPLIKQELQYTILARRHMSGKGEVELETKKMPMKRELTEAELEKKRRRKEQNRRAAERCRIKKKKMNDKLNLEFLEEQKKSQQLAREVEQLRKERDMLLLILKQHTCTAGPGVNTQGGLMMEEYSPMTSWSPPPVQDMSIPSPSDQPCATAAATTTTYPYNDNNGYLGVGDPFDEVLMYPNNSEIKQECQTFPSCTLNQENDHLPELDLLNEFVASEGIGLSPCSPSMMQGRVSISDYIDQ
ncbi:hypothetical protein ACF0H5_002852 [Mactra antiquata]